MTTVVSNAQLDSVLTRLTARSRALGADRTICNWGGGNTSSKTTEPDHIGRPVRIMWVKGSGSDLASVTPASFTGLRLDEVVVLRERARVSDAEMVAHLRRCMTDPDRPRASIETMFHALHPAAAVDHTHADATNYFACAVDGERLARELFGSELIWIPYQRPGFALGRRIAEAVQANPLGRLIILQKHGSITWGDDDAACTDSTMSLLARAKAFVEDRMARMPAFGGERCAAPAPDVRHAIAADVMPLLRGAVSGLLAIGINDLREKTRHGFLRRMCSLKLCILGEHLILGGLQHAIEAAQHDHWQHDETVLGGTIWAVTQAAMNGVSEFVIMKQTGHKTVATLRRYIRSGEIFRENAAAGFGI